MDIFSSDYLRIALGLISALILFLYAIENLSKEIQELASERFREKISRIARNSYLGTIFGALATGIIQSSSAVTVITVILVNTGIISFRNSLGILFGSNIGTTVTAQLALVNSTVLASLFIIIGFFIGLIGGRRAKIIGKPVFFLGFILFSLSLLSSTIEPLKNNPDVIALFSEFSSPILAYFVSALFTGIIHSSSITSGIIVILAQSGLIPIEVSIPMILGANLGSSITAILASSRLNLFARRVGTANFMFNAIGTALFMLLLHPFIWVIESIANGIAMQTALAHVLFNVFNTLIFLVFLNPFENLIIKMVKGNEEEIVFRTKYLKRNGSKKIKPKERIDLIKKEITYSVENTIKIYQMAISLFYNSSSLTIMNIHKLETLNDYLDDRITESILELSKLKLSPKSAKTIVNLIKISNTIEQLGDLGMDFSEVFKRMHSLGIPYREVDIERLTSIHNRLIDLFRDIEKNIVSTNDKKLAAIKLKEEHIYNMVNEDFDTHVERLQGQDDYDGNIFVDAISIIELSVSKVRDIRKLLIRQLRDV